MPLATSAKDPANTYRSAFSLADPSPALPYVGEYQVPVNRPPFFKPTLHPMTPFFFIQSTPNDPLFSLLYQILHKNCKFLRARAF